MKEKKTQKPKIIKVPIEAILEGRMKQYIFERLPANGKVKVLIPKEFFGKSKTIIKGKIQP